MKKIAAWILLILALVGIFFIGRQFGGKTVSQQIVTNSLIVREIAELATLEVQGNTNIKRSNLQNDGSWSDNMKKLFMENTIWVQVPYTAKYGVDVDDKNFQLEVSDKKVVISLPAPQLLSYELKLDRMETSNRKGLFMAQNDETYTELQKKLYQESRQQLEQNVTYRQQTKDKIKSILARYYEPMGYEVQIRFGNESPVTISPVKKD